jgi:hypothetical protein
MKKAEVWVSSVRYKYSKIEEALKDGVPIEREWFEAYVEDINETEFPDLAIAEGRTTYPSKEEALQAAEDRADRAYLQLLGVQVHW